MSEVFHSIIELGKFGFEAVGPFKKTYRVFPFLFAYAVDYVERVLLVGVKHGRCCECLVLPKKSALLLNTDRWKTFYGKRKLEDLSHPDAFSIESSRRKSFIKFT